MNATVQAQRPNDLRRRMAIDVALSLAELNAGWGDYDRALEHLSAAEQLTTGTFAGHLRDQRESWLELASPAHV